MSPSIPPTMHMPEAVHIELHSSSQTYTAFSPDPPLAGCYTVSVQTVEEAARLFMRDIQRHQRPASSLLP